MISSVKNYTKFSGGSRISRSGGAPTCWGGTDLRCVHFLAKTYVKTKEIDPVGGGGGAPAAPPPWIRQCKNHEGPFWCRCLLLIIVCVTHSQDVPVTFLCRLFVVLHNYTLGYIWIITVAFHRFKDMDLVKKVHIFGLSNIHTFELNIILIRLFSLISIMRSPDCWANRGFT